MIGRLLVFALVFLAISSTVLFGQAPTGSISGVVSDATGAVVPGVKITITDIGKGISRNVTTDSAGRYQMPGLLPSNYSVEARVEGFQTEIRSGIQLTVGQDAVINLSLQVGQVAQTTEVTGEAPLVETVSGTVAGLVDNRAIRDLPLNGRSFDQLISLQSSMPAFHNRSTTASTGRSSVFSISGGRGGSNIYLMDGQEVIGASYANVTPGSILGKNMGVEAIQEFSVLASNYSAAYGKRGGGVITMATRSGTNQIHGSAYEFLRNSDLDARNFFDNQIPPFRRNQFGASVGGRIKKDRTFYFGNYEGLRESLGVTSVSTVPDDAARARAVPAVRPYLALFPRVNGRVFGDGTGEALASPSQPARQDFFLIRVDHRLSEKDSIFARYNFTDAKLNLVDADPLFNTINPGRDQLITIQETRTYATLLNAIRFGYLRSTLLNDDLPVVPVSSALYFYPYAKTIGQISFGSRGVGGVGNALTSVGTAGSSERYAIVNQFESSDQVNYYLGAHSLSFGAKYERIQHNDSNAQSIRGQYTFTSLDNFLAGTPSRFIGPTLNGDANSRKSWRGHYFATFLQDDYKLRPNLTVNLGVRWEFMTSPTEASGNLISNFAPIRREDGVRYIPTAPRIGAPLYHTNFGTVAPRIGFAWDVFGNGKMAVRGGFGTFYDQIEKAPLSVISSNPPFFQTVQINNPGFPNAFSGASGSPPLPSPNGIDVNADAGTLFIYNFGIERQITANSLLKVGYVGSHGYHLGRSYDANTALPVVLPDGQYFYPAGAQPRNPNLGSSRIKATDTKSFYNSLQIDYIQRVSNGLRYKLSYTWAKSVDDSSSDSGPDALNTAGAAMIPDKPIADRSLSAFDIRHNFVANFTYDLPWQNSKKRLVRAVGGWQIGSIMTFSSGFPFVVLDSFNQSRDLNTANTFDRPSVAPGASNNPVNGVTAGCGPAAGRIPAGQQLQTPDRWFDPCAFILSPAGMYGNVGRDTVIGPGMVTIDMTLVKIITISEGMKLDFRSEFFNLLNRANFGLPSQNIFQSAAGAYLGAAGRISATTTTSRQIQFGLKLIF